MNTTNVIRDAEGHTTTAHSYQPARGQHISQRTRRSGIGPATTDDLTERLTRDGHVILVSGHIKPWNHHVIGFGVLHDDAAFAETGRSLAPGARTSTSDD